MAVTHIEPISPGPNPASLFAGVTQMLDRSQGEGASIVGPGEDRIPIPPALFEVIRQASAALSKGRAVSVVEANQELTTQQAAELLNVSRPFLVKLLERGELPFRKSGTHRRIELHDVLRYRTQRSAGRLAALAEMAADAQSRGTVTG